MARSEYTYRTSYFKVTDEDRFKELSRGFPESTLYFNKYIDGQMAYGFGDYQEFKYYLPASECPVVTDAMAVGQKFFDVNGEPVKDENVDDESVLYDENGDVLWNRVEDYDGEGFDWFLDELQKILTDDSAFVFVEAGHYKLNFVDCFAIVATKKAIRAISLDESIASVLEELTDDTVEVQWTC